MLSQQTVSSVNGWSGTFSPACTSSFLQKIINLIISIIISVYCCNHISLRRATDGMEVSYRQWWLFSMQQCSSAQKITGFAQCGNLLLYPEVNFREAIQEEKHSQTVLSRALICQRLSTVSQIDPALQKTRVDSILVSILDVKPSY